MMVRVVLMMMTEAVLPVGRVTEVDDDDRDRQMNADGDDGVVSMV